ncbi:unnamed protein product, partial [Gulo gulo]
ACTRKARKSGPRRRPWLWARTRTRSGASDTRRPASCCRTGPTPCTRCTRRWRRTSSCWEPRPLRTDCRTASATPSSASSRGTSKCGYSQGISKVGPRAARPHTERGAGWA